MQDPYATLGVSRTASDDEIKKVYRKLAAKYHPDLNPGDKIAEQRMQEVNRAYELIKDLRSGKITEAEAYGSQNQGYEQNPNYGYGGYWYGGSYGQNGHNRTYTQNSEGYQEEEKLHPKRQSGQISVLKNHIRAYGFQIFKQITFQIIFRILSHIENHI